MGRARSAAVLHTVGRETRNFIVHNPYLVVLKGILLQDCHALRNGKYMITLDQD